MHVALAHLQCPLGWQRTISRKLAHSDVFLRPLSSFLLPRAGMPFPLTALQVLYVNSAFKLHVYICLLCAHAFLTPLCLFVPPFRLCSSSVLLPTLHPLICAVLTSISLGVVLALEEAEPGVMTRKPRRSGKAIVGKFILWRCFFVGGLLILAMLGNMEWQIATSSSASESVRLAEGRTVAMTTLVAGQAAYIFNCRYLRDSSLRSNILHGNPFVLMTVGLNLALQCLLIYAPGIQDLFSLAPIGGLAWLRCLGLAAAVFVLVEVEKIVGPRFVRPVLAPCLRCMRNTMFARPAAQQQLQLQLPASTLPQAPASTSVSSSSMTGVTTAAVGTAGGSPAPAASQGIELVVKTGN